jgi:endonuclease/exonuclease/phosphatase (EEP) superfamily protein YafD
MSEVEGKCRRGWRAAIAVIGLLVASLFAGVKVIGTWLFWLAPLVYMPPQVWPLLLLSLGALSMWRRFYRLALVLGCSALVVAGLALGWPWPSVSGVTALDSDNTLLRVLTWNQGQHYDHSISDFIAQQRPDVIALQDASMPLRKLQSMAEYKVYPHITKVGEFALLSRFAITQAMLVPARVEMAGKYSRVDPDAARFEIDFHGRPIVIYTVHAMSPRYELDMLFGIQQPYPKTIRDGPSFWQQQRSVIEQLLAKMDAETLPTVVLGDWNMPPMGVIYRHITRGRQDAHATVGSGAGFTCPGDLWTPLTWGKPWLRIDYVLTTSHWQPLSCVTEPASHAQHCSVAALVRLR